MNSAKELLQKLGVDTVKINVFRDNIIAKSLYDNLGFEVLTEHEKHFEMLIKCD